MKNVYLNCGATANHKGFRRRDVLKVGGLSLLGLSLPDFLRVQNAQAAVKNPAKEKNCILLFMNGGPSHLDTWDPKPDAPGEYRGEFNPLATNVDGIQISEHLPNSAKLADKYAIVRSLTSSEANHERACHYMLTGYRVQPNLDFPAYGSVVLHEKGFRTTLPPYVAIPQTLRGGTPGYLGTAYQPLSLGYPGTDGRLPVRKISHPVESERLATRAALLTPQDARLLQNVLNESLVPRDKSCSQTHDLATSPEARKAFDLSSEPEALRQKYGNTPFGMSCLLARRMVEAGTRFVTISYGGWDTHGDNFQKLRDQQLPPLDLGFSALLSDLEDRGLLQDTLVLWMGEFGRTPRINQNGGRDHWPKSQCVVFAGGGVHGGQVVGKSDATGSVPDERPVTPEDLAATIYALLGIDAHKAFATNTGQPIRIAEGGQVVRELIG